MFVLKAIFPGLKHNKMWGFLHWNIELEISKKLFKNISKC